MLLSRTLCFLLLLLPACSKEDGRRLTADDLAWIRIGATTLAEVEERFGEPDGRAAASDGATTLLYSWSRVGPLGGDPEVASARVVFQEGVAAGWSLGEGSLAEAAD